MGSAPGDSFPVVITDVSSLGCRALYLRWDLLDCAGVGGYEVGPISVMWGKDVDFLLKVVEDDLIIGRGPFCGVDMKKKQFISALKTD